MIKPVEAMRRLAVSGHAGQCRKWSGAPYINHPRDVVERLRSWGFCEGNGLSDAVALAVAWGHDLLEDTDVTCEQIEEASELGKEICEGIRRLTFVRGGDGRVFRDEAEKEAAKRAYIREVAEKAAALILAVKIADRLCNSLEMLQYDDKKAYCYAREGQPLYDNVGRLPPNLREVVAADIKKTIRHIDEAVATEDLWDMMTDETDWAGGYDDE